MQEFGGLQSGEVERNGGLEFPRKLMRPHGRPERIVTDRLRCYGATLRQLGMGAPAALGAARERSDREPRSGDESERCSASGG